MRRLHPVTNRTRHRVISAVTVVSLLASGVVVGVAGVAGASGAAAKLGIINTPSSSAASGATLLVEPQVAVQDSTGATVTSDGSTVLATITPTSGGASLAGNSVVAASGVANFSSLVANAPVGNYTVTFSDGSLTPTSMSLSVSVGAATQLAITRQPSPGEVSGVALVQQPVVAVEDSGGNVVTSVGTGTATAAVTGACTITGGNPSGTFVAGVATFSGLTMTGASNTSCTLTFSNGTFTSSASSAILMSTAPTHLVIATQPPTSATSGAPLIPQPVVNVEDSSNTIVKSDSSTVTAVLTSPSAGSSLTNATVTAVNGVATFSGLAINASASSYTLTFTDGSLATATSNSIALSTGGAAKLSVIIQPSTSATNGVALGTQPVIAVQDSGGNLVTSNTSTVSAAFTTGGVSVLNATAVVSGGYATFSGLTLSALAGNYTLTFSDGSLTSAVSGTIAISAGAATKLVITTQPSSTVASGARLAVQPVVKIEDSGGNVITSNYSSVVATITSSAYSVSYGTVSAVAGVATYTNLALNAPIGTYTLTFTDNPLSSAVSASVSVSSAAATKLVITTQPSPTVASGVALAQVPVVKVEDANGNVVTSDSSVVVARITAGGVSVSANAQTAVGGVATFYGLALNALAGTYTLTFSDGTLTTATSTNITVYVGPASKLVITTEPSTLAQNGAALATQPVVAVEDSGGNIVTTTTGVITAGIAFGTGGAISAGSTANIVSGVARFSGLAITGTSGGVYGLVFTGASLSVTDSVRITLGSVQAPLVITKLKGWLGRSLALATSGGSGTGTVTFSVANAGTSLCSLSGNRLFYKNLGTCVIVATKAASGNYQPISSAATTITIALLPKPAPLTLGFRGFSPHLYANQIHAILVLDNRLTNHSFVRIVAFAPGNLALARARGVLAERILKSRLHLRVQLVVITHTRAQLVRLITISQ